MPGVLRLGVLPAGKGWRKGECCLELRKCSEATRALCLGKKKKRELIDLGCQNCWAEEVGGARSKSTAHAVPLLRVIHSLAFLCWESRSRLCLKKKQRCTWAALRTVC